MDTIEEGPSAPRFKHEPLPDSTKYIRLLEIQGVDSDGHVECLLTAWPVAEAPDYYAIPYTWGSPNPVHWIFINGFKFPAGENCVLALEQAYSSKASRHFWMDALCIDQKTTQEKSHQVGMMGQIYAKSVHVLACVGRHTDDSTSLFRAVDKNKSLLASIYKLSLGSTVENTRNWVRPNPIPKSSWVALRSLFAIGSRQRQALTTIFIAFMKRTYFSRVWILQELHLAPRITLCCGMDTRSFDYLLAMSMLVDFWVNASNYRNSLTKGVSIVAYVFSRQSWFTQRQLSCSPWQKEHRDIQPQCGCLTLASGARGRRRLAEVLEAMQNFQCTDVRDRLFGILALVEWGHGTPAVPDYGKDNCRVAIEVLRIYLENSETEPVSGVALEWSHRLSEIFDIREPAILGVIATRYKHVNMTARVLVRYAGSREIPYRTHIGDRSAYRRSLSTFDQNFEGHPRDTWNGVKLRDIKSIGKENPRPGGVQSHYLYCTPNDYRTAHGRPSVEILDHMQRVFAYGPADTRPHDWLLICKETRMSDGSPPMVVVKNVHRDGGIYAMIGQASKDCEYKEAFSPLIKWRDFGSRWQAEDLFLFACMYNNRSRAALLAKDSASHSAGWNRLGILMRGFTTHFHGVKRSTLEIDLDREEFTPRYNDRRIPINDLDLENPLLAHCQENDNEYDYLMLVT